MSIKPPRGGMVRSLTLLAACGLATGFAGVANAQDATDAGRTVANIFTLDYSVNGTEQPPISNNDGTVPGTPDGPTIFTVDRLVDLTLISTNSPQLVAPGTLTGVDGANNLTPADPNLQPTVLTYTLTNTGNDNQAYSFDIDSPAGDFVAGNLRIFYEDAAGNFVELNTVTAGSGATVEVTEDIPAGETRTIFILADIPTDAENNQFDDIILTAETRDPEFWAFEGQFTTSFNADGTLVTTPVASPTPNTSEGEVTGPDPDDTNTLGSTAENVLADGAGDTDIAGDGLFSDTGRYVIAAPNLTGVKTVSVIATDGAAIACGDFTAVPGPISGTQFSTSGACVEYTITVTNNGADDDTGTALPAADVLATGVDVVDVLPPELIFQGAEARTFTVAPTASLPAVGTLCDASATACTVSFTGGELAGNPVTTGTVVIRALVQ